MERNNGNELNKIRPLIVEMNTKISFIKYLFLVLYTLSAGIEIKIGFIILFTVVLYLFDTSDYYFNRKIIYILK